MEMSTAPPILCVPLPKIMEEEYEEDEFLSDIDLNPMCDFLYSKFTKKAARLGLGAEFVGLIELSQDQEFVEYAKAEDKEMGDDTLRHQLGFLILRMPEFSWGVFKKSTNPDHLKLAIKLVATLLYLLVPKRDTYQLARYPDWSSQLNQLWTQLTVLLNSPRPSSPLDQALCLIMDLTTDPSTYSLVTETDVSDMIPCFCARFYRDPPSPLHPYKPIRTKMLPIRDAIRKDETEWYDYIMEVIDTIDLPPPLQASDHAHLLIKILGIEPIKQWFLSKLNIKSLPCSDQECPPLVARSFYDLIDRVIDFVKGMMVSKLSCVLGPFNGLSGGGYDASPEVYGLINTAEIRRIALGSRFITRSHFLWAYFCRGYVLPQPIMVTLMLSSADADHPPYHIYLASLELAKHFSEKAVCLENFIFCVINSQDISPSADKGEKNLIPRYEKFREVVGYSSSNLSSKRLRSGELKEILQPAMHRAVS